MGMFDSVYVECPYCGSSNELQTKRGECILGNYSLDNAPPQVLLGIKGNQECYKCGELFNVGVQCLTRAWVEKLEEKEW